VAESYFSKHPDMRATFIEQATAQGGTKMDPDALLWSRWTGSPQFYQDPLYAYLIGLTYRVIGDDVRFVFAWQMALGVMSTVLIWLLARRFFGDLVAACAGALAVLCGPLVYYELFLLRESTIVFAGLGIVWLADRALTRGTWAWFVLLGLSLGLACLLKSSLVLLGLAVALGIVLHFGGRWRELRMPAAATLAGFAIAMTPLAARNMAVGAPPLALAGSGGLTFLISNDSPTTRSD
jgi:4-amino-4-deoxy-L-arabinose transferase-like glycosyltransferase